MAIKVVQEGRIFIARSDYADKDLVKAAGFRWNPDRKIWWTDKSEIAAKLAGDNSDIVARINADREAKHQAREASIVASHATDAAIEIPLSDVCRKLGLDYLPYQRAGIAYAAPRQDTLIGDEMGLGKTIQAAGVINATPSVRKVLVVCPASLKINWERELRRWLVRPLTIGVANGGWPMTDVVIVNYDVLRKFDAEIKGVDWDLAVFDEAHYVKNGKAQRTQAIFGKWDADAKAWKVAPIRAARRLFLTGTPILNRPKELWTIVHALDRKGLGDNWRNFHVRYCAGYQGRHGWNIDGASHLDELNSKLRAAFMIRRLKSEVLTELPAKRRQVIVLEPSKKARALIERQNALAERVSKAKEALQASKATEDPKAFEAAVAALDDASGAAFEEMSALRHEIALAKLPQVIEHVRDALDGSEGKILVFAHHRDVVEALTQEFADVGAVKLMGGDSADDKQSAVDRFQTDPSCRVFIGSIKAAGVGITLTAATHVVFAEQDWTPGWNQQAEDRAHRIGQRESVLIQYVVLDGSLDAHIAQVNVDKAAIAEAALDKPGAALQPLAALVAPPAAPKAPEKPAGTPQAPGADDLTRDQIAATHEALKIIAGMCDGAQALDDRGFNKLDSHFGKDLAGRSSLSQGQAKWGRTLAIKYGRQLPAELLAIIKESKR
jgi:SWI/SNF-related matrix-associated actin-dependent regulator of chromatin subfamily A-like protein 1